MTDTTTPGEHHVDQLPRLLAVEGEAIVCYSCRRKWRVPADGRLSAQNFAYLCEHADDHARHQRDRPPQRWNPNA